MERRQNTRCFTWGPIADLALGHSRLHPDLSLRLIDRILGTANGAGHIQMFGEIRELEHTSLNPGLPNERALAAGWDAVALWPAEDDVLAALKLMLKEDIDRIAFVGDPDANGRAKIRRCIVKLRSAQWPVPLQSLGDGVMRLLRISLALAVSKNGLLLIDEIENGIHYSIQSDCGG